MLKGSRPLVPVNPKNKIERAEILTKFTNLFFPATEQDAKETRFGVVIGPSGSGKTCVITELCNKFPEGTLYYEVREPSTVVSGLSKEINMKTAPTTILDLALGYVRKVRTLSCVAAGSVSWAGDGIGFIRGCQQQIHYEQEKDSSVVSGWDRYIS